MSDDSFIREVEEELRSDRLKGFWDRFGTYIIAAAVIVVIATAAWTGYEYYTESRANASGDTAHSSSVIGETPSRGVATRFERA